MSIGCLDYFVTRKGVKQLQVERHFARRFGETILATWCTLNIRGDNVEVDNGGLHQQDIITDLFRHRITAIKQFLGKNFTEQSRDIFLDPIHVLGPHLEPMTAILVTLPVFLECNRGVLKPNTVVNTQISTRIGINGG